MLHSQIDHSSTLLQLFQEKIPDLIINEKYTDAAVTIYQSPSNLDVLGAVSCYLNGEFTDKWLERHFKGLIDGFKMSIKIASNPKDIAAAADNNVLLDYNVKICNAAWSDLLIARSELSKAVSDKRGLKIYTIGDQIMSYGATIYRCHHPETSTEENLVYLDLYRVEIWMGVTAETAKWIEDFADTLSERTQATDASDELKRN